MISKETFKNAISKIDDKYIVQAVGAGTDVSAEEKGQNETERTSRKSSGVRRSVAGTRSAIIAASLIVVGIIAGIAITIGVRHRKNVSPISGEAETESPTDGLVFSPTAVPIPENYIDAPELIDLIYSDSVDPAVSDPAALPMTPPGARDDVRTLRRASDALAGKTLTVRVNYMESNELFAAEPVFALFRDVAGGEELDSGTVVLMLSKNVYGDESVPQLVTEVRSVLISGRTDNISNLFLFDNSSFSDFFGPITVEQVSIISFLDHMYPREAVYAAVNEFSLKYGNFLYSYPLYTLMSDGDNAVKQPLVRPASVGVLGSVGSGVAMPVPFFMDAGSVDLKPLLETFERFGISCPDTETVDGARFADNIHSSVDLIEAFLLGYPDFATVQQQFDFGFQWTLRSSIKRSEEGIYGNGVQYTYLFKFDDEAVIVRTPVLFDTGYKGYDGLNELGYYISFGGERYTCASEYVPLTNGNSTERFTNWQRMGGEQRKLIADAPVFTVERCSLSEYDAIANGFLSVSSRETVTREEYIKQYERDVEAARNGGKTADATPTPYTTPAPPAPTPTKPAADESETAELVRREIDMDGNGKPELLAVYEKIPAGGAESSSTLIIEITDGEKVIFSRQLDSFHMNRNSFSLVTDGEKQFILEYTPYISTGIAFYSYALYGTGPDGTPGVTDSGEVRFNSCGKEALPAAEMAAFAGKVNAYLSGSEIIVSTLGGSPVTSGSIPEECFAIFNDVLDPAGYPSLEAWLEECSRILQDNYRGAGG